MGFIIVNRLLLQSPEESKMVSGHENDRNNKKGKLHRDKYYEICWLGCLTQTIIFGQQNYGLKICLNTRNKGSNTQRPELR